MIIQYLRLYNNELKFNKVFYHERQGIPKKDLLALLEYVQKKNIVLLIRPVEALTKTLHEQGRYPTKNFNIKGKTASWGAWAGFIPIDQSYSKLSVDGTHHGKIKKTNKEVQDCIKNRFAQSTHLIISGERIRELNHKKIIYFDENHFQKLESKNIISDEYLLISCPIPKRRKYLSCYAKKINDTEYAIYTYSKEPFQVLADMHLNKPFIADYDLLAIFTPWENFNQDNIRPNTDVTYTKRLQKFIPEGQSVLMESEKNFYGREIPNLGNIAPKTIKIISELNKKLNKGSYLECIHHNDDAGSPASDPTANYPITALSPTPKGPPDIVLLHSDKAFVDFIEAIKQHKYRVEANPLWEQAVQLAAKEDFYQKIIHLESLRISSEGLKIAIRNIFKDIGLTDSTLIKEITYVVSLIKDQVHINFKDFSNTIKSCVMINSVLISQWCSLLEELSSKKLLSNDVFLKTQTLMTQLKEDLPGFSELSATIINIERFEGFQHQPQEKLNELLILASRNIHKNKLDKIKFKAGIGGLMKLSLKSTEESTTSILFKP